ncbi:helicase C-terminal domain-containing protein [Staphylococcus felis]|uniref:helicase C-terminal domain-containing protein n=1 Tax=Staphylococcus felis TaxID=46127 RepID=UPI0021D133F0|nr:helicase C-terminal domain-containing protein [Staphylococcus felis]UXR85787.1 DEAD/DEAH box helicase [Staphylococcus felis]
MYHHTRFAVVDLETTGNHLGYDEIIQIGITFVENNKVVDTYHSMIKTHLEIPTFIQALTSIESDMLSEAPYFSEVAKDIYNQIKDCVFVAHNVNFDLIFLKKALKKHNINFHPKKVLDTLEIFQIAFPTEKSYQLSELATSLNIPLTQAHRADEDAHTTALLLIKAFDFFKTLPINTKKQLYYLSKHLKYNLNDYLFEMVRYHDSTNQIQGLKHFDHIYFKPQSPLEVKPIDFSGNLKDLYLMIINKTKYQYRESQLYLSEIIFNQLMNNEKTLVEAETGSGKSLAYIVAAIMYYIETGEHVMISTNTKLLQNQLLEHDIPIVNRALKSQINAKLIKSKQDYISLGLISDILKEETSNYEVNLLKMQLLIWILSTDTGDIQELNLRGSQQMYMAQKNETYTATLKDSHYYNYIKNNAAKIQIGVTNHAHLLHSSTENSIYQLFRHCIIDEAHRLPDYALNCSISELSYSDIKYQLGLIGKTEHEKLLKQIDMLEQQRILQQLNIPPIDVFTFKSDLNDIHETNEHFFNVLFSLVQDNPIYDDETSKLHFAYDLDARQITPILHQYITKVNQTIENFKGMKHKVIKAVRKHLLYIRDQLRELEKNIEKGHTFYISLKNINQKSTIRIHTKNTLVKDVLTKKLLEKFDSITFISGTLTFNHSFSTFEKWFDYKDNFNTYQIKPTHRLKSNGHIFVPNDIEKYNYQNHDQYIETMIEYISRYVNTIKGKCLILFTSYQMLYTVMDYLNQMAEFEDYVILSQQPNQNYKIVQQFNHFDKAILLGTTSFFEGFDYQSAEVKCVMIAKLPFMSQYADKPMLLKDEFNNIFKDYILPEAVIRFRQGLGRLLRNENDKGIIVSFDSRLLHSSYTHFFLDTLSQYHTHEGSANQFEEILNHLKKSHH